jgi:Ion channel
MLSQLLLAWSLMALCVVIHAVSVTAAIGWVRRQHGTGQRFWPWTWLLIRLAGWIIVIHLVEIAAWAVLYVLGNAMPDLQAALYFSAQTYTTTGYGDLVVPADWRLAGGVEALTGILMSGLSTGFFFAVVGRMFRLEDK